MFSELPTDLRPIPIYRRNADEDLRRLERDANDPLSQQQHQWELVRAGQLTLDEYMILRAEVGDPEALQEVITKKLRHTSLVCDIQKCPTLLKQIPGATLWGQTWKCGKCAKMYKVCCGQRMATYGRSRFGPGEISCRVCDFEKDFT